MLRGESYGRYLYIADADLISFVAEGDAGAFAALYERHSRASYSLAYRMMKEQQASEDLIQDTFVNVWQSAGGYRADRGSVRTWILSIIRNRGIDQIRSTASRRRMQDRFEASVERSQPSEAFASAWRNVLSERAREALATLPHEQREAIALAYFSGHTHKEIAGLLGLPLGTVKGRMRLGLKKVREHLEAGGYADGVSSVNGLTSP